MSGRGTPSNLARWQALQAERRHQIEAPVMELVEALRAEGKTWTECVEAVRTAEHLSPLGVPYTFPALTQGFYKWKRRQNAA